MARRAESRVHRRRAARPAGGARGIPARSLVPPGGPTVIPHACLYGSRSIMPLFLSAPIFKCPYFEVPLFASAPSVNVFSLPPDTANSFFGYSP